MRDLIKLNKRVCAQCQYRMRAGASPGRDGDSDFNYCCNYMEVEGHSRIFENGVKAYDAKYCDKYKRGKPIPTKINWNQCNLRRSDNGNTEETDDFGGI